MFFQFKFINKIIRFSDKLCFLYKHKLISIQKWLHKSFFPMQIIIIIIEIFM